MGIRPAEYNDMTPYELNLCISDFNEKRKQEYEEKVALVWLGESLHRRKKLPTLSQLLEQKEPKKQMTADEMYEKVKMLNAAFGGEVK
jgi:hypothetical protein